MDRRPGSGRPKTVTTPENEKMIKHLRCKKKMSTREIERKTGVSRSTVKRMIKINGWK